jgi:hypothetical protein
MSIRTTETTVTFRRSLTEEEQIPGLSFVAFRRTATLLHLPADPVPGGTRQVVNVSPDELAEALASDAA